MESSTTAKRGVDAATIAEAFRITAAAARRRGRDPHQGRRVSRCTWGELRDRVDALAGGLSALGAARGDTVALMLSNRPEFHLCRPRGDDDRGDAVLDLRAPTRPSQIAYVVADAGARDR